MSVSPDETGHAIDTSGQALQWTVTFTHGGSIFLRGESQDRGVTGVWRRDNQSGEPIDCWVANDAGRQKAWARLKDLEPDPKLLDPALKAIWTSPPAGTPMVSFHPLQLETTNNSSLEGDAAIQRQLHRFSEPELAGAGGGSAPVALADGPPRPPTAEGAIDLGFPFPVQVWRAIDPECAGALEVYESCIAQQLARCEEELLQFGYLEVRGGRRGLEQQVATGVDRAGKMLANLTRGSHYNQTRHRPNVGRYFYRDSVVRTLASGGTDRFRLLQLTYVRSMKLNRVGKNITTYPPAPVSNLVVAIVPGRVIGEYVCNLENGEFVAHPSESSNPAFLTALNTQLLPVLQDMWSMDFDLFGGDQYRRGVRPGGIGPRRWSSIEDGQQSLEPIFSPTLFQTEVLNPAIWYGHTGPIRPSQERPREFAMGVLPCGPYTLAVMQYPTSNTFDRRGAISETQMRFDAVMWVVDTVAREVRQQGKLDYATASSSEEGDLYRYFTAVRGGRRRGSSAAAHLNDNWLHDQMGRWITEQATNHPVLPIEVAYRAAAIGV